MTNSSIGESLRRARGAIPASIYEAARETRIRVDYIEAMEKDSFRFLSTTYVRGMLRSYVGWLGLDVENILEQFDRLHGKSSGARVSQIFKEPLQAPARSKERLWVVAAVVAASVLLVLSLVGVMNPTTTKVAAPPAPPSPREQASAPTPAPSVAQAPPVIQGVELKVVVTGEKCWLQVLADGASKPAFSGTLFNGQEKVFNASQQLKVTFGKIDAIQITLNGTPLGTPTGVGESGTFVFYPDTKALQRS